MTCQSLVVRHGCEVTHTKIQNNISLAKPCTNTFTPLAGSHKREGVSHKWEGVSHKCEGGGEAWHVTCELKVACDLSCLPSCLE